MRITVLIKLLAGSILGIIIVGGVGIGVLYSRDQFAGLPVDHTTLALVGGRVFDPFAQQVLPDVVVVVRGSEISTVDESAKIPEDARVFNVSGLTLLPGLIDSHVHFAGIRARIRDGSRELGWASYFWRFIRKFPERRQAFIQSGITTVKSLGDPYPWILELADRIERHDLAGPRIFAGGPMFTAPGGHPVAQLRTAGQGDTSYLAQVARQVSDPAAARAWIANTRGKIAFVTVVLESRGPPTLPTLDLETLAAISSAANDRRLPVLAHVSGVAQVTTALEMGVAGIEHVPADQPLDTATVGRLATTGTFVVPTLQALEQTLGEQLGDTAAARRARNNAQRLARAGVPLVAGSDAPSPGTTFGFTLHEELRNLVELGLTPGEAIAAATASAARYLGRSDRLGSIAPGKSADIIAVAGDPLSDIEAVAAVHLVIADGQVLWDRLTEFSRPGRVAINRSQLR